MNHEVRIRDVKSSEKSVTLISWNVNGIRAALKKGLLDTLHTEKPDIFCLQETRARPDQITGVAWPDGYRQYWNPAEKAGYAGTATFTRIEPLEVIRGIGKDIHDREGRVLTLEFPDYFVVNCYTPNAQRELTRLGYRQAWDRDFLTFLKQLERKKPVIFGGDINVAHTEIDLARPKQNVRNHGFTIEERTGFGTMSCRPVSSIHSVNLRKRAVTIHGGVISRTREPATSGGVSITGWCRTGAPSPVETGLDPERCVWVGPLPGRPGDRIKLPIPDPLRLRRIAGGFEEFDQPALRLRGEPGIGRLDLHQDLESFPEIRLGFIPFSLPHQ
jgi:exodeoxyribonuclease III